MSDDFDALLQEHRSLREQMPRAWNAFFARFGSLRPVQLKAMPPILAGASALITAPTAGGKTEAVMAPICERLTRHRWRGLSVLLITPTRALVNDLFTRLSGPLNRMGIRVGRKTSDHRLGDQIVEQVLVTTPESTESLLMLRRGQLNHIQAVVLDEIHLLDGTPRGDHLRALLSRLSAYRHHIGGTGFAGLQRIAMSATVAGPRRLADCYAGEGAQIVAVAGQRDLEARIILANGTDKDRAEAAIGAVDGFKEVHKLLVFVNSRKQVDVGAGHFQFGRFSKVPVYGHHGSLSKSRREEAEERFKSDPQAICVATMTLEVGIDIGDIDLVICMDPPFSLSSFLQRIGRGCRRLNGRTRVLCVARDRAGELMFDALVKQAALGLPPGPMPPFRRSVLVQQVLAYLKQVPKNRRVLDQFVRTLASSVEPSSGPDFVKQVVSDMVQTGLLDKQGNVFQPASDGWDFIESNRIFTNIQPNPLEIALVDVETGETVASVAGVSGQSGGLRVAGRSYDLLPGGSPMQHRVRAGGKHIDSPRYHARMLPYAFDIGAALASRFGVEIDTLLTVRVGESFVLFTWLGRLLNAILAETLRRRGYKVAEGSFHLTVAADPEVDLIALLRQSVTDALANNPLGDMPTERLTDLGPHQKVLSPAMQRAACKDWLDSQFLTAWVDNIHKVQSVLTDSELAHV